MKPKFYELNVSVMKVYTRTRTKSLSKHFAFLDRAKSNIKVPLCKPFL